MTASALLAAAWGIAVALPLVHRASAAVLRSRVTALAPPAGPTRARPPRPPLGSGAGGAVRRVGAGLWGRLRQRHEARTVERGVPLALDVLTMAARAGYTPRLAVDAAARWSPDGVADAFAAVQHRCELGASLADALDDVGRWEPAVRPITEGLVVAERSGAPIADLLARLADDARASLRRRAEAHARRVPVRLLFPLVFLVLPAFGLLTVVPALAAGLRNL